MLQKGQEIRTWGRHERGTKENDQRKELTQGGSWPSTKGWGKKNGGTNGKKRAPQFVGNSTKKRTAIEMAQKESKEKRKKSAGAETYTLKKRGRIGALTRIVKGGGEKGFANSHAYGPKGSIKRRGNTERKKMVKTTVTKETKENGTGEHRGPRHEKGSARTTIEPIQKNNGGKIAGKKGDSKTCLSDVERKQYGSPRKDQARTRAQSGEKERYHFKRSAERHVAAVREKERLMNPGQGLTRWIGTRKGKVVQRTKIICHLEGGRGKGKQPGRRRLSREGGDWIPDQGRKGVS